MKKAIIILLVCLFLLGLFGLSVNTAGAYDSGCIGSGLYSITTGQLCSLNYPNYQTNAYSYGCTSAGPYNTITGQLCYGTQTNYSTYTYQTNTNNYLSQQYQMGERGAHIVALQQTLTNAGFFVGRIDGVYGPLTDNALTNYRAQYSTPYNNYSDPYNSYPYSNVYPYNNYNQAPTISGVSGPQSLAVNQVGTWTVSASNLSGGNLTYSVNWGDQPVYAYGVAPSALALPQQNATFTHSYIQAGTYPVIFTVTNSYGQTAQSSLSVVVGGYGVINPLVPSIYSLSPTTANVGDTVSVYGSNFSSTNYLVTYSTINNNYVVIPVNFISSTYLSFVVPANVGTGLHTLQLKDINNTSILTSSVSFTISNSGSQNYAPAISYLSPTSGRAGTQITIFGSGFGYSGCSTYSCPNNSLILNTVNFGSTTIPNIYSSNGSSLTFTVPLSPITSGVYPVSVTNTYGTSNSVSFSYIYP